MPDSPPLLAAGFHAMTLDDLKSLCVDPFATSTTRIAIHDGLREVVGALQKEGVTGELWADGSFLTEKVDPNDSDVVLIVSGEEYDLMAGAQRDIIDWVRDDEPKAVHRCDSYVHFEYPPGHANHGFSEWMRAYWIRQFGFSRGLDFKGIARVTL